MFSLRELLTEPAPTIRIVDAGAAEYQTDPFATLSESGLCEVIGFEPNAENCTRRNATARPGHRYLPHALGDGGTRRFYETQNPLTSSLYRPNAALLEKFSRLFLPLAGEHEIETRRLDDVAEAKNADYLKLDVQGAELDIIRGAPAALESVLIVHTEVEFIPVYVDQPLFGDVDVALRAAGFWLHRFDGMFSRVLEPLQPDGNPFAPMSQLLWADAAIYVRSFMTFDRLSAEQLLKLAIILHEVYGSWDLAALALRAHEGKTGKGLWQAYLERLMRAGIG
jgi:FkbM family methyltransferase